MRRRRVLVMAFGPSSPSLKGTPWLRAGQFAQELAAQGIDLEISGAVTANTQRNWRTGRMRRARQAGALTYGSLKRLVQSIWLPYRYDAVVVLRDVLVFSGPPLLEKLIRRRAVFYIFELDDALWAENETDLPYWTPEKPEYSARVADRVIAGNSFLADWARRYCDDVTIVPTSAADDIEPRTGDRAPGPVRIGWCGKPVGSRFLEPEVIPALRRIADKTDIELVILTESAVDKFLDVPSDLPIRIQKWTAETEARDMVDFDIGLMPLKNDDTSRGKCGAKILHYMAAALPVVASPVGVNNDIVEAGETGYLPRSVEEWAEALLSLARDAELRERMGKAGRKAYEDGYSPSVVAHQYAEAVTPPEYVHRKRLLPRRSRTS